MQAARVSLWNVVATSCVTAQDVMLYVIIMRPEESADLTGADLRQADLRNANLVGADCSDANL